LAGGVTGCQLCCGGVVTGADIKLGEGEVDERSIYVEEPVLIVPQLIMMRRMLGYLYFLFFIFFNTHSYLYAFIWRKIVLPSQV
jgi:hypothetical protein